MIKAVIKNEQLREKRGNFFLMKLSKYQQHTLREGSFVVRNLRANFHDSLLLTVNFEINFHAKHSSL